MVADRLGGMTLDELQDRMSMREFLQWVAQFKYEAEQRKQAEQQAKQQQRGRAGR